MFLGGQKTVSQVSAITLCCTAALISGTGLQQSLFLSWIFHKLNVTVKMDCEKLSFFFVCLLE